MGSSSITCKSELELEAPLLLRKCHGACYKGCQFFGGYNKSRKSNAKAMGGTFQLCHTSLCFQSICMGVAITPYIYSISSGSRGAPRLLYDSTTIQPSKHMLHAPHITFWLQVSALQKDSHNSRLTNGNTLA